MATTTHGPSWGLVYALAFLTASLFFFGWAAKKYVGMLIKDARIEAGKMTPAEWEAEKARWRAFHAEVKAIEAEQASR